MLSEAPSRRVSYTPVMTDEMIEAAIRVLRSGKYIRSYPLDDSEGKRFEDEFCAYLGCRHAANVSSGTAAMHLALLAVGVGPGDEVITVPNTFSSVADAIILCGAKPVFVDVEPDTYNMDVRLVEAAVTPRTKAVMPVHMNGHAVDMDPLMEVARRHGLKVVEDVCHAAGGKYKGRFLGTIGDAGCFSFVQNKCISMGGEGGLVATDDERIWELCMMMANHGRGRRWFEGRRASRVYLAQQIEVVGFNYRQNEVLSAIGRLQLRHLDEWNTRRRTHAALYHRLLGEFSHDLTLPVTRPYAEHAMLRFVAQTPRRDALKAHLERHGVHVMVEYGTPIHLDHAYQPYCGAPEDTFPVTERLAQTILSFPCYQTLGEDDIAYVAGVIRSFYTG
ncbi:MAG: DegT/DnrJ/EryC1/StrS family aminotransferase [Armatimonadota bacterium]|nr:DegT/DnrJ/EryC1/StrS family aminotransferase [Armatimonadota bacterium]